MEDNRSPLKLQQLKNFLLSSESDESRNYLADLLTGGTNRPQGGSGLGLYISKGIIEAHGGRI